MYRLVIIIPAYNEEKRIYRTLEGYLSYFDNLRRGNVLDFQIFVVINGSTDGTEKIVRDFSINNNRINYINLIEGGKGNAVITGFKEALKGNCNLIGFSDADMATPPEEFFKLIKACEKSDGAIADRYRKESSITPRPSKGRLIAKRAFNFVSRSFLVLPFRDTQCGAKVFRREALEDVIPYLTMSKWAFDVELLYNLKKRGHEISSVPINWFDEEYSTINFWKSGPGMVLGILRLRIINSPLRDFMRLYDRLNKWKK